MTEQQLADRIRAAVPDPPPLDGLAERAAAAGRRRRMRGRMAATGAVAAAVAAVLVLPGLVDGGEPVQPAGAGAECVSEGELTPAGDADGEVVSVRFCSRNDGQTGFVRFPDGALTGPPAPRFVANWPSGGEKCSRYGGRDWRIQVATSSGTVYERTGNTEICADAEVYRQLVTLIGTQLALRHEGATPGPPPQGCPAGLAVDQTNQDGESAELLTSGGAQVAALSTTPLLALPAVDGLVCRYAGTRGDRRLADSWQVAGETAEALRVESMLGYMDGMTDCAGDPDAAAYVVVLQDFTGTARTFSIDGTECSPMSAAIGTPPGEQYLGLARPGLESLIAGTRA